MPGVPRDVFQKRRAVPVELSLDSKYNWNAKYQALMGQIYSAEESMLQKGIFVFDYLDISLVELIGEFQEIATIHAMRMIDEYHITPIADDTVKTYPVSSNMCCVKSGIVLQFACNYNGKCTVYSRMFES